MFSEIINPFLNVRNKIKDKNGNWVDQKKPSEKLYVEGFLSADLGAGEEVELFNEIGKKVIIESIEYTTGGNGYLTINSSVEQTDYYLDNPLYIVGNLGSRFFASPSRIEEFGSPYLEVTNSTDSMSRVELKRPLELPEGCQLTFTSAEAGLSTAKVVYRVIEE